MLGAVSSLQNKKMQIVYAVGGVVMLVGGVVGLYRLVAPGGSDDEQGEQVVVDAQGGAARAGGRSDAAVMIDLLNESIIKKAEDFFYPAKSMVETTRRVLNKYSSVRSDSFLEKHVYGVVSKYPQIDNFYIADSTGSRVIAANRGKNQIQTDVIDRSAKEPFRVLRQWDGAGKTLSVERHTQTQLVANPALGGLNSTKSAIYDARKRPWFKKAVKTQTTCWSNVYLFSATSEPGITVASPVMNARGEPLFVVAADFEIRNISHFLADLEVGGSGLVFIMNGKGELIAYPEVEKVLSLEGGKPVLAKAQDVVPPWAKSALTANREKGSDLFVFTHDGASYIASFAPFLERYGNDWQIVVVALEDGLLSKGVKARG